MLQGMWPERGCEYCRQIEQAGGQSDRMTNLDMAGIHAPEELDRDPSAVRVSPRIVEVYFNNTCNLKCTYCGPHFSSLWDAENKQHGIFHSNGLTISSGFAKDREFEINRERMLAWIESHANKLTNLNVLGGEPLFQPEFEQLLTVLERQTAPYLTLQIFSNLHIKLTRLRSIVERIQHLVSKGHIRSFTITASLDCWGPQQEYARFPLDLAAWQTNFEYLLGQSWIDLVIGSTITPLTITTLWQLVDKINQWNQIRPVAHYFNSVNWPSYMFIDILGDHFVGDFERALELMPLDTNDRSNVRGYLQGLMIQSASRGVNRPEVLKLRTFLTELDRRRGTDWRATFPELVKPLEMLG